MKRAMILMIHAGYWALFALLLLSYYFFAFYIPSRISPGMVWGNGLLSWIRLMTGFAIVPGLVSFYTFYSILFDRLLKTRRFFLFIIASFLTAFIAALAGAAVASLPFIFGPRYLIGDGYNSLVAILLLMTGLAWVNGIIATVIRGCLSWFLEMRLKEELHVKTREAELALIRSRIDPHFLFNTLNNIDILILKDPELASGYLNILSGMLRFLLYETTNDRVRLEEELVFLQQYLDLQKIRTAREDYIRFDFPADPGEKYIAPMIFLPFIENAFKHTANQKASGQIKISLQLENNKLIFYCANSVLPDPDKELADGGLGNELVLDRLRLLYPGKHSLLIDKSERSYIINLELDL